MRNWTPNVGDLVTPDPEFVKNGSLRNHFGETFTVVKVNANSIDTDRGTAIQTAKNWDFEVWMPAKSAIINKILSEI